MYDPLRRRVLAFLKVPPEPHPPQGDPASLRVFRAGRNYFRLRLAGWAIAQILAFAGIVFWTVTLIGVENAMRSQPPEPDTAPAPAAAPASSSAAAPAAAAQPNLDQRIQKWKDRVTRRIKAAENRANSAGQHPTRGKIANGWAGFKQLLVEIGLLLPPWAFPLIWVLKIAGFVIYLVQIPLTYAVRRLDYEMHWYMVTDRSLRLRHGVWHVAESTMSFANLQQVVVMQNPIQRLLGLADVKVTSAGGGGKTHREHPERDMHTGLFHAVEHAEEIRDLILKRLEKFRSSGLGDPDDHPEHVAATTPAMPVALPGASSAVAAAQELLAEARLLRSTVTR
jgi:membrane protein YdbS with pleckstrin-like domain